MVQSTAGRASWTNAETRCASPQPDVARACCVVGGEHLKIRMQIYGATGAIARILPDSLSRTTVTSSLRVDSKKQREEADFGFVETFGG
jgi:hypothetical protein